MAKIYTYSMMLAAITGMMILGGIENSASSFILSTFGISLTTTSNIFGSLAVIAIIAAISLGTAVGISGGIFGRSVSESYILGSLITGTFCLFLFDWVSIINYIWIAYPDMAWLGNIFAFIFGVISIGFCISLIQFWRGNDI